MSSVHKRQINKFRGTGEIRVDDETYRDVKYNLVEFVEIHESRASGGISHVEGLTSAEGDVTHPRIKMMSGQTVTIVLEDGRLIEGIIGQPHGETASFRGWGAFQREP